LSFDPFCAASTTREFLRRIQAVNKIRATNPALTIHADLRGDRKPAQISVTYQNATRLEMETANKPLIHICNEIAYYQKVLSERAGIRLGQIQDDQQDETSSLAPSKDRDKSKKSKK